MPGQSSRPGGSELQLDGPGTGTPTGEDEAPPQTSVFQNTRSDISRFRKHWGIFPVE